MYSLVPTIVMNVILVGFFLSALADDKNCLWAGVAGVLYISLIANLGIMSAENPNTITAVSLLVKVNVACGGVITLLVSKAK